jgi:hypothetical protein
MAASGKTEKSKTWSIQADAIGSETAWGAVLLAHMSGSRMAAKDKAVE